MIEGYHKPVMLSECLEALDIKENGTYVDVTFGGGGHSKEILKFLGTQGRLYGFDQDSDALQNVPKDERFKLLPYNFSFLSQGLRLEGQKAVDGILADLGVSSFQLDTAERGFSFRFDAKLDMRMNQSAEITAADIIATYSEIELQKVLGLYGEVRNAKTLAASINRARQQRKIERVSDLMQVLEPLVMGKENRYYSQVFQALRMEVNNELTTLKEMLAQTTTLLKKGGRLVVLTYHSLEDRVVKNWMKHECFENEPHKDDFGNIISSLRVINKKPILPTEQEVEINPRARSAKLRIAEKL
jgi:16S rRNA (cytosine1402-N4)-methyltransferase